jgi:hypothetical protein
MNEQTATQEQNNESNKNIIQHTPPTKRQRITKHPSISSKKNGNIKGCTYNINNGRGERLITAVRAMSNMNMDFALLTETKNQQWYTRQVL